MVTVKQGTPITGLSPGAVPIILAGTIDTADAGTASVTVTASVRAFSSQTDPTKPACTQADFALAGAALVAPEVPMGARVRSWSGLSLRMVDAPVNQDNCKAQGITIDYVATTTR